MLPPTAFRRGDNRIDIYELAPASTRLGLVPLGGTGG
jgi:hypothetical protein